MDKVSKLLRIDKYKSDVVATAVEIRMKTGCSTMKH